MSQQFMLKVIQSIRQFVTQFDIKESDGCIKITSDCVYCGRSKRGLPHFSIIIQNDGNKITGGVNCFRCGSNKSLRSFLLDLSEILHFYGISKKDIYENVSVIGKNDVGISIDFNSIFKSNYMEEIKFYSFIENKYSNDKTELKKKMLFYFNGFTFIKNRLNLSINTNLYEAFELLSETKSRVYVGQNKKLILSFDNKVRYVFDIYNPSIIKLRDERDVLLYGSDSIPFILNKYSKLKSPNNDDKYYMLTDSEKDLTTSTILNVYVCEGVFDALSMKYYKNMFDIGDLNNIENVISNVYSAVCHSRVDRFVLDYVSGIISEKIKIPPNIKSINIVLVPDLNMNVKKYITSIFKFIQRNQNKLNKINNISVKYLDVYECFDNKNITDVNDIVTKLSYRMLRNIKLVSIY